MCVVVYDAHQASPAFLASPYLILDAVAHDVGDGAGRRASAIAPGHEAEALRALGGSGGHRHGEHEGEEDPHRGRSSLSRSPFPHSLLPTSTSTCESSSLFKGHAERRPAGLPSLKAWGDIGPLTLKGIAVECHYALLLLV